MTENPIDKATQKYKVSRARVVFIYFMAVVGVSFAPLDSYLENGSVDATTWKISLLSFFVGALVIEFVLYRVRKYGKFMHYDLNSRQH